jgi:hypothetical protein
MTSNGWILIRVLICGPYELYVLTSRASEGIGAEEKTYYRRGIEWLQRNWIRA